MLSTLGLVENVGATLPLLTDLAIKSAFVLAATGAAATLLRHHSASVRHMVWGLGVIGVLALPALTAALPEWSVPAVSALLSRSAPAAAATPVPARRVTPPAATSRATTASPVAVHRPAVSPRAATATAPRSTRPSGVASAPAVKPAARGSVTRAEVAGPAAPPDRTRLGAWLLAIWAIGVVAVLLTVLAGLVQSRRLAAAGRPVTDHRRVYLRLQLARLLSIRRPVRLLETDGPSMPMTWGARRPVILLPAGSATWSDARLRAVLLHELAHVKRLDYLTQLLARVACAFYWFNPLTWYAARRMREERELACDDLVLAHGSPASEYAGHLLEVARVLRAHLLPAASTVCLARRSTLRGRLLAVLDATRARAGITPRFALPATALALAIVLPVAGAGPSQATDHSRSDAVETPVPLDEDAGRRTGSERMRPPAAWRGTDPVAATRADIEPADPGPDEGILAKLFNRRAGSPAAKPADPRQCDWSARSERTSSSTNVDDDRWRIRISIGDCELRIDAEGEVEFTDDETDVARISRDGYFEIEEREGRARRRMEFKPVPGGGIERTWLVDGREQWTATGSIADRDPEAAAWLSRMLLVVFRRSGFDAQARATRILERGGIDSLLQEVAFIRSDWAAGKYYAVLLSQPGLDVATIQRIVRTAGQEIESDHTLAELLVAIAENQPLDEAVRIAYVEAAGTLQSDYQHARVLSAILQRQNISRELTDAMLRSSTNIDSDYQRSQVVLQLLAAHPLDQTLTPAYFAAIRDIESDYQQHQVISAILERGSPSLDVLDRALGLATSLESDHHLAELLMRVAELYPLDGALPRSYLDAARTLDSDYQRSRVLGGFLERESVTEATVASVLEAAGTMSSSHQLGTLLRRLAERGQLTPATRRAFFGALERLESDHEHGRVLMAVIEHQTLDDAFARLILASGAAGIASDHSLSQVLIKLAERHTITDALRPDFMRALDAIESEHTRGRVLNAVFPRSRPA